MTNRGGAFPCERCAARPATICAIDEPENDGSLMFGDEVTGVLLCGPCLRETEAQGPWDAVEVLDEVLMHTTTREVSPWPSAACS
jgi:hypothetical protein